MGYKKGQVWSEIHSTDKMATGYTYNCDTVKAENSEDFKTPANYGEHSYTTEEEAYTNGEDCDSVRRKLFRWRKPGIGRRLFQDEPTSQGSIQTSQGSIQTGSGEKRLSSSDGGVRKKQRVKYIILNTTGF